MFALRSCVALFLFFIGVYSVEAESDKGPFASVVLRGDAILATFPSEGRRWGVQLNGQESHISKYGETLTLRLGDSLSLSEHHGGYLITVRLAPRPGLQVESDFAFSSFGKVDEKKSFFLRAQ